MELTKAGLCAARQWEPCVWSSSVPSKETFQRIMSHFTCFGPAEKQATSSSLENVSPGARALLLSHSADGAPLQGSALNNAQTTALPRRENARCTAKPSEVRFSTALLAAQGGVGCSLLGWLS